MPATARRPPEDQDPVVLELLRLAAETILAHPGAVPPALYNLCDTWADDLASALAGSGSSPPSLHRDKELLHGRQAGTVNAAVRASDTPAGAAQGGQPR